MVLGTSAGVGLVGERPALLVDQSRQDRIGAAQVRVGARGAQGWPAAPPGTPVFVE